MKIKQTKGITLIALVITIIVLLILAGVTISMLTGENGILNQATNAKNATDKSEFEEQVSLAVIASRVNNTASINLETLEEELNKISGAEITKSANNELPWTVKKGNYEVTITGEGNTSNIEKDNDDVMENAKKAMPTGGTIDKNTNAKTGIVMIDSNQNEWVWIEVPATVFTSATSGTDYDNIKADLIAYAKDYRYNYWDDDWSEYVETNESNNNALKEAIGISSIEEYNYKYREMLSSIYTNKGFYIGRYEAGIAGSDTDTSLARYERTEITSSSPEAVSKKDMIPYNYVYCSDAQQLANEMSTGNKTSSLLFGIQWDLVCKFLEVKGTPKADIKSDSSSWGNYANSSITLSRGKYNIKPGLSSSTWTPFSTDTENYVTSSKTNSSTSYYQLLTTGASEDTKKMNIYDFAGNEWEWTLEYPTKTSAPCSSRGSSYYHYGYYSPAFVRSLNITTSSGSISGFRSSLY